MFINIAVDPNRIPELYLSKLVGNQDYANTDTVGGLTFNSGDDIYLLLRNQDGW